MSNTDTEEAEQLENDLLGDMIRPGDPGYDDARMVWNGMIDRHPAAIARVSGAADVIRCVEFARQHDWPLAVRGGGHNVSGSAVCTHGLVIDFSGMTGVRVDPDSRTAWVEPGATWRDVDHETQQFGLATPGGVVSDTGVAGLTLGGGIGHLRCRYGLTCDNLQSVDVVTADGELVTASQDRNEELFWGLRGAGGNFGVVTGFEFDLHPVGPEVATLLVFYPATEFRSVMQGYREYVADSPRTVSTLVFAGELPDEELFSGDAVHQQKFAIMGCSSSPVEEGTQELMPLRELAEPLADFSGEMRYTEFQRLLDEDYPEGMRYYWKSLYLDDLTDSAIDRMKYWAENAPSPLSTVDVWELGGAINEVGLEESAFPGRHAPYLLGVEANWVEPENDEANVEWVRDCLRDMRQFSDGSVYLNFPGFMEDDMMETTFGSQYERLVDLKDRVDPGNLFSHNQNITPSREARSDGGEHID